MTYDNVEDNDCGKSYGIGCAIRRNIHRRSVDISTAYLRYVHYGNDGVDDNYGKEGGFSVRCARD